jgi:hypothetical protein
MKYFKKFFQKQKQDEPTISSQSNETFIDVIISLNKNLEVDISLYLDCNYKKANIDLVDYILICSKFLNFDENKLKTQMINILDNQIKNEDNELFINGLVSILKNDRLSINNKDNFYIQPSQVFIKHIHEHQ